MNNIKKYNQIPLVRLCVSKNNENIIRSDDINNYGISSATLIGPNLALTCNHVLDIWKKKFGEFLLPNGDINNNFNAQLIYTKNLNLDNSEEILKFDLIRSWSLPNSDLNLLYFKNINNNKFKIAFGPPKYNDSVFIYGNTEDQNLSIDNENNMIIRSEIKGIKTIVTAKKSALAYRYPHFSVLANTSSNMSGGPCLNEKKEICGIIGSGINEEKTTFIYRIDPLFWSTYTLNERIYRLQINKHQRYCELTRAQSKNERENMLNKQYYNIF